MCVCVCVCEVEQIAQGRFMKAKWSKWPKIEALTS